MDDNGFVLADFKRETTVSNRSLGLSSSEPRFSKYQPFVSTQGITQSSNTMNPGDLPDARFAAATSYQHSSVGVPYDSGLRQSGQVGSRSRHAEWDSGSGTREPDYLMDSSARSHIHRRRDHSGRPHSRNRNISGTGLGTTVHPHIGSASSASGWDSFSDKEQYQSYASLGVGFASLVAETLLSHPCIVLRRQCQVMNDGQSYHLLPFSLVPVIYNLHKTQGIACLWKGIGSVFIVRGLHLVTENVVSEITHFPKEVNRHSSAKKLAQHLCLKAATWALVAPFYAASLVETVQSDIASDSPGVLDCLKEGLARLLVFSTPPTASSNLLPFWKLVPPVVCLGAASYAIRALANYAVMRSAERDGSTDRAARYRGYRGRSTEVDTELYERFYPELLSSFVGALLSDLLLFPLETLTHRLCVQGTRTLIDNMDTGLGVASLSTTHTGLLDAFVTTVRLESPVSLYRGFGALLLQFGAHLCLLRAAKMSYERLVTAWAGGSDRVGVGGPTDPDSESTSSRSIFSDVDEVAAGFPAQ
ncbi:hypothetical protein BOX15_Mlig004684g3 [Macrostomum lignano]|uniref:Solute carrier family 25 member 46 n=1 Tax=Macrostomum lignano TaxID=282301 RepID=A0A267FRS7_9PLAT|nr:hypothetical protein BOX15_Mlig004684g3 [Macrostomum lignano]